MQEEVETRGRDIIQRLRAAPHAEADDALFDDVQCFVDSVNNLLGVPPTATTSLVVAPATENPTTTEGGTAATKEAAAATTLAALAVSMGIMGISGDTKTMEAELAVLQQQLKDVEGEVGGNTDLAPIVARLYRNLEALASEVARNKKKANYKIK